MATVELPITGMTCASCANRIERRLNKLEGVSASVNYATEKATVDYEASVAPEQLLAAVEAAGYHAVLPTGEPQTEEERDETAPLRQRPKRAGRNGLARWSPRLRRRWRTHRSARLIRFRRSPPWTAPRRPTPARPKPRRSSPSRRRKRRDGRPPPQRQSSRSRAGFCRSDHTGSA